MQSLKNRKTIFEKPEMQSISQFIFTCQKSGAFLCITGNGNVGINTTTPGYPLHVNGSTSGISIYAEYNISAEAYIDRTPFPDKGYDALTDIKKIKSDNKGRLDHSTLPGFVRAKYKTTESEEEIGRDLGSMINVNTVAIQQLIEIIETGNYTIERTVIINQTAAPLPLLQNETLLNQTLINQTSLNETAINQSLINQTLINATQPVNLTLPANQTAILELNQKILELETRLAALESMLEQVNGSVIIRFG